MAKKQRDPKKAKTIIAGKSLPPRIWGINVFSLFLSSVKAVRITETLRDPPSKGF
ncbi:MAG: hypothetical protein R6V54_13815 [Desulfobacteraceae bacterium]